MFERSDLGCITMTEESAAPDDPTTPEEMTWVARTPSGRGSRGSSLLIRPGNKNLSSSKGGVGKNNGYN